MQLRHVSPVAVALCCALTAGTSGAAALNVLGFDDMTCAAWNRSKDDSDLRKSYILWARGVLTGHNYALQNQQVSTISSGTIELNINHYCSKNPSGLFSDATFRLSDEFSGRNQPIKK